MRTANGSWPSWPRTTLEPSRGPGRESIRRAPGSGSDRGRDLRVEGPAAAARLLAQRLVERRAKPPAAALLSSKASQMIRVDLAVDEIATNIIAHGYGQEGDQGDLELWVEIDDKSLTVCIEDTGLRYDPRQYRRPQDLDLPPDQRPVGGLGVYLTLRSVDRFSYERFGDRNRHTLIINR